MGTKRSDARALNRARVLTAARKLFADPGYEHATARMLAEDAGISVGGVFANFRSMEDILAEIVMEGYDTLTAQLTERQAGEQGSPAQRLKESFRVAFDVYAPRHAMLMHQLGASWTWSHAFEEASQRRLAAPFGFVGRILQAGKADGALRGDLDVALAADMLLGGYLRCWRHGWYRKLTLPEMIDFMDRQIDLLLEGAASR